MHTKNLKKYSFTILELIFAIVIVGLAVTSIPSILAQNAKGIEKGMQEHGFFNAYALTNIIGVRKWDENNTVGDNNDSVLTAINGDSELLCSRKGIKQLNNNAQFSGRHNGQENGGGPICAKDDNQSSVIGVDSGEDSVTKYDDIDDFNGYSVTTKDYNVSIKVTYMSDESNYSAKNLYFNESDKDVNKTNIKLIEAKVYDRSSNNLIAVLKTSKSNIGQAHIKADRK